MSTDRFPTSKIATAMGIDETEVIEKCQWVFSYGPKNLDDEYARILKVLDEPGPWRSQPTLPGNYWFRHENIPTVNAEFRWIRFPDEWQKSGCLFVGPVKAPGENDA